MSNFQRSNNFSYNSKNFDEDSLDIDYKPSDNEEEQDDFPVTSSTRNNNQMHFAPSYSEQYQVGQKGIHSNQNDLHGIQNSISNLSQSKNSNPLNQSQKNITSSQSLIQQQQIQNLMQSQNSYEDSLFNIPVQNNYQSNYNASNNQSNHNSQTHLNQQNIPNFQSNQHFTNHTNNSKNNSNKINNNQHQTIGHDNSYSHNHQSKESSLNNSRGPQSHEKAGLSMAANMFMMAGGGKQVESQKQKETPQINQQQKSVSPGQNKIPNLQNSNMMSIAKGLVKNATSVVQQQNQSNTQNNQQNPYSNNSSNHYSNQKNNPYNNQNQNNYNNNQNQSPYNKFNQQQSFQKSDSKSPFKQSQQGNKSFLGNQSQNMAGVFNEILIPPDLQGNHKNVLNQCLFHQNQMPIYVCLKENCEENWRFFCEQCVGKEHYLKHVNYVENINELLCGESSVWFKKKNQTRVQSAQNLTKSINQNLMSSQKIKNAPSSTYSNSQLNLSKYKKEKEEINYDEIQNQLDQSFKILFFNIQQILQEAQQKQKEQINRLKIAQQNKKSGYQEEVDSLQQKLKEILQTPVSLQKNKFQELFQEIKSIQLVSNFPQNNNSTQTISNKTTNIQKTQQLIDQEQIDKILQDLRRNLQINQINQLSFFQSKHRKQVNQKSFSFFQQIIQAEQGCIFYSSAFSPENFVTLKIKFLNKSHLDNSFIIAVVPNHLRNKEIQELDKGYWLDLGTRYKDNTIVSNLPDETFSLFGNSPSLSFKENSLIHFEIKLQENHFTIREDKNAFSIQFNNSFYQEIDDTRLWRFLFKTQASRKIQVIEFTLD